MHVMIDIETMGINSDAAIIEIGAVAFLQDRIVSKLFIPVNLQSSIDAGLSVSASTIEFWNKHTRLPLHPNTRQNGEYIYEEQILPQALATLEGFIPATTETIWCNGASFDFVILKTAYNKCKLPIPWEYYQERDYRTIKKFAKIKLDNPHNALLDAVAQVDQLMYFYNINGYTIS